MIERLICTLCSRKYVYSSNKRQGHTKTKCNSCSVNIRRHFVKDKAITTKGGKCQICGYNRCKRALHFHHVDDTTKTFSLSGNHALSWKKIEAELDKCVLVCSNCHAEIHDGLITLPVA